jgi:hypothetical protein
MLLVRSYVAHSFTDSLTDTCGPPVAVLQSFAQCVICLVMPAIG